MDEDALELHISDTVTAQDSGDRFEAFQLSLQRWPLFHHVHQHHHAHFTMSQPEANPHYQHLLEPEAIPIPPDPTCMVCGDSTFNAREMLHLSCDCYHCDNCLTRLFTAAMTDESLYPPSCHRRPIALDKAIEHLPRSLVREYATKSLELSTKKKLYCSNTKGGCNAFIAPHSIHNSDAFCQKCNGRTCVKCKEKGHFGPCSTLSVIMMEDLAKDGKWKVCPGCTRLVEKADGCNHILCRCGSDFCYSCGKFLNKCVCVDEDDEATEEDEYYDEVWFARGPVITVPRSPNLRELEEDIIEDTLVAPFDLEEDESADR